MSTTIKIMCIWNITLFLITNLILQYPVTCYRNHTALSSIVFTNIEPPEDDVHSEYYFGRCAVLSKTLIARQQWTYPELQGKMIVRGWLAVADEPTCIYIRSKSSYGDLIRYHAFKFNVCVCRLVYNYGGHKFVYFYYEWFIPVEMKGELTWDLLFYLS